MARGVYDVDFIVAVADGHILGEDGDAALTLKVIVVKNQFARLLVVAEEFGLVQHAVHQGGLAVVNVGYNRNITYILHRAEEIFKIAKIRFFSRTRPQ